jgi:hypothetical protein
MQGACWLEAGTRRRMSPALLAHACNPSYSGVRDQEDRSSKPTQQIVLKTTSRKKNHNKGLVELLKV